MHMQKHSIRTLVITICCLITVLALFTVASHATSVKKGCHSRIGTPWWWFGSTDVKVYTHGWAQHVRIWFLDHRIHVHRGGGRAYASVGDDKEVADPPLSENTDAVGPREKTFHWLISTTTSPNDISDLNNFKVYAALRGHATDSAFTYGWVREGKRGEEGYSVVSSCTGQ